MSDLSSATPKDGASSPEATISLTKDELSFLSVMMEANYGFITLEERKARQSLRDKIKKGALSLM